MHELLLNFWKQSMLPSTIFIFIKFLIYSWVNWCLRSLPLWVGIFRFLKNGGVSDIKGVLLCLSCTKCAYWFWWYWIYLCQYVLRMNFRLMLDTQSQLLLLRRFSCNEETEEVCSTWRIGWHWWWLICTKLELSEADELSAFNVQYFC